jgi:ribonucleoside-triphosphate reductase
MKCPYCSSPKTIVVDKRLSTEDANRRRRECLKCGKRFTTYERLENDIAVVKKDGRREPFDGSKLKSSILKACTKRPISLKAIDKTIEEIEKDIQNFNKPEVESKIIGELAMDKLRKLDEVAYVRFASYYKHFTDIESFTEELGKLKVVREVASDSTDLSLMVASPTQASPWSKEKIIAALMKETNISKSEAEEIGSSVEKKVFSSGIKTISVSLIRELVNNELFTRGLNKKLEKQEILGMPVFNVSQVIFNKTNENSNITSNNPEAVSLAIAENTLKQYALKQIFSKDVADAHLTGAIHVHNLGYPVRLYCSAHSLDFIKKFGLRLFNLNSSSSPPKHAMTLTGHLNTFLASMQAYYAGALGVGYINIFYAPLLVGMSYNEMKQQAQYIIFSCSQNAFSRGGQTLFIDFNVHLNIPSYLKNVPAIGSEGKYMLRHEDGKIEKLDDVPRDGKGNLIQREKGRILTYGDFEKEAQLFARALLDVWRLGDSDGKPFAFPKCDLHVNQESFDDPKQLELLKHACQIASENGAPYFAFDRGGEANLSQCCRLRTKITDNYMITHTESMRFCGFLNVTINLPQASYRAGPPNHGDVDKVINEIYKTIELAVKAHLQKKKFIQSIMNSPGLPLWQVGAIAPDGRPYIDLDSVTHIIGIIGLNECVKHMTGKNLHESDEAYKLGLKIISAMNIRLKEFENEHKIKLTLEETPAESSSMRFAKIDLQQYPESKDYVRGDKKTGEIYYTNSIHFVPDAPISIIERIDKQGRFNPLIESGAITHVFVGEKRPDPESIFNLVKKTWENTQSAQIVISPEFTFCSDCHKVSPGYKRNTVAASIEEKAVL